MHVSCRLSGMLLARLGRPEVSNCILGLRQYSQAYEEASEHALRIEHIYEERKHGGDDDCKFVHMSSTVLQAKASLEAMAVDEVRVLLLQSRVTVCSISGVALR